MRERDFEPIAVFECRTAVSDRERFVVADDANDQPVGRGLAGWFCLGFCPFWEIRVVALGF
jgi:hypothetical protein